MANLDALGPDVAKSVEDLLWQAFIVNVPLFEFGKPLRIVLRTCLATPILYHQQVAKDCGGGNVISAALNKTARDATDPRFEGIPPEALLCEWSNLLAQDLEKCRLAVPTLADYYSRQVTIQI